MHLFVLDIFETLSTSVFYCLSIALFNFFVLYYSIYIKLYLPPCFNVNLLHFWTFSCFATLYTSNFIYVHVVLFTYYTFYYWVKFEGWKKSLLPFLCRWGHGVAGGRKGLSVSLLISASIFLLYLINSFLLSMFFLLIYLILIRVAPLITDAASHR